IVKYDAATGARVAATAFGSPSTIKLTQYANYLLVGNWYGSSTDNLRIFSKDSLKLVNASFPEIDKGAKDLLIVGDSLYVSQNYTTSSFSDSAGYLAVISLRDFSFSRYITFNNNDEELGRLVYQDSVIYGLNGSSETITSFHLGTEVSQTLPAGVNVEVGGYGQQYTFVGDELVFKFDGGIGSYNLSQRAIVDSSIVDTAITAFVRDTVNQLWYLTQTDFFSFSKVAIYDDAGQKQGETPVGNSPEALGMVYNRLPMAAVDSFSVASGGEVKMFLLGNDSDPDLDPLSITLPNVPSQGSLTNLGDSVLYTAPAGFSGLDSFYYVLNDVWGDTDTAWVYLEVGNATPLEDELLAKVQIYPNPAQQNLWIEAGASLGREASWEMRSTDGRLVGQGKLNAVVRQQITLPEAAAGAYFLRIRNQGAVRSLLFLKQ
ncbi:MAG: Ig-like domain-containing protein, partial [Bacteroidota bacterium]